MDRKQTLAVLVVEDSLFDRRLLESMLVDTPHPVSLLKSADSLKGALNLLSQYTFDVVILDLNLKDSHGEASLIELHRQFPSVAVVVNTGAYEEKMGLEALSSGAQDFLVKDKYNAYILNKTLHYAVERKRIEHELQAAHRKLKETQFQLVQAEKMKVVGGLASGVAHEVKNPLSTILYGITYLSQKFGGHDQKVDSVLSKMQKAITKANYIVTDLLNFSSLTQLTKKKEDLKTVVDQSIELVSHEFARNKIRYSKHFDHDVPEVEVDKNRIEQVIINLILNAVHATPAGGQVSINVTSRQLNGNLSNYPHLNKGSFKSGDTVVMLSVEDEGRGVPADKMGQIFDPFFTTRRTEGGVGLGLSVSKNIMDIHKGCIFVENKCSGGARATIVFKAEPVRKGVYHG